MIISRLTKLGALTAAGLMAAVVLAGVVQATLATSPVFNAYDTVQLHYGVGSESDFLRLGASGELGNTLDVCTDGQVVDLWFYIHNSTAASANGADFSGPGVAHNTMVRVAVDETKVGNSHSVVASIDSDETNPVTDSVTINCGDQNIQLKYKKVSHFGTKAPALTDFGNFALVGDIKQGAYLGYQKDGQKGIVPGCWEYRARINVQLQVEVVQPEEEPEEIPEETPEEPPITDTGSDALNYTLAMLVLGSAVVSAAGYKTLSRRN